MCCNTTKNLHAIHLFTHLSRFPPKLSLLDETLSCTSYTESDTEGSHTAYLHGFLYANYIIYKKEDFSVDLYGFVHMHRYLQGHAQKHRTTITNRCPVTSYKSIMEVLTRSTVATTCITMSLYIYPFSLCVWQSLRCMSRVKTTDLE